MNTTTPKLKLNHQSQKRPLTEREALIGQIVATLGLFNTESLICLADILTKSAGTPRKPVERGSA